MFRPYKYYNQPNDRKIVSTIDLLSRVSYWDRIEEYYNESALTMVI